MAMQPSFEIPAGYNRAIRFGANWTLVISPYLLLSVIVIFALGGMPILFGEIEQTLEIAGNSPFVFGVTVMLDAIFHVLFLVNAVTLFAVLRSGWPVRASLVLVGGTWQMVLGLTKGLSSLFTFSPLGAAYVNGDTAIRAILLHTAASYYGLRLAFQAMDGFGVILIWIVISLLPPECALPRALRWLGWILSVALLFATPSGPTFLIVVVLFPVWLFLLGRWIIRLLPLK